MFLHSEACIKFLHKRHLAAPMNCLDGEQLRAKKRQRSAAGPDGGSGALTAGRFARVSACPILE